MAARPANAAAMSSAFDGRWPDRANAADVVQGKLEIGHITERQADNLRFWIENGYVLLEEAIPPLLVAGAALDLDCDVMFGEPPAPNRAGSR